MISSVFPPVITILKMAVLVFSFISATIVFNVGASHCPPFDVNTVNVKGVLGENIHMQCDIDQKLCDNVLWKKKPSAYHLNETGCDNGYCIHHTTDRSVLEFPNISPDNSGSYECWCYRGQPEPLLISCFELSAVCQMRISLTGNTLVHNGSVSSIPTDATTIDTKPGDRHEIVCQDRAEHITTCTPLDDGTFTVTDYEQECWHLCSMPVKEISETCDVRVSFRIRQSYGQQSVPESEDSLGVVHGNRAKRDSNGGDNTTTPGDVTLDTRGENNPPKGSTPIMVIEDSDAPQGITEGSTSTKTNVPRTSSTGDFTSIGTTTKGSATQKQNLPPAVTPPQSDGIQSTTETKEPSPRVTTSRSTDATTTNTKPTHISTDGSKQERSKSEKPTSKSLSFFDECQKLSIFVAVGSFILSLVALLVAVSCCCYACFAFRHTGTAEITSKEAGGDDDIALEGVTVKDVTTEDTEDLEKDTKQEADKSSSPAEQPSGTVSDLEPATVKSSETTEASVCQEEQEKSSTDVTTGGGDVVAENHVVDETTQPEIKESPKETVQEANNVEEVTATEEQKTKDPESPEML